MENLKIMPIHEEIQLITRIENHLKSSKNPHQFVKNLHHYIIIEKDIQIKFHKIRRKQNFNRYYQKHHYQVNLEFNFRNL